MPHHYSHKFPQRHCFERFSSWQSLVRAMASLIHIVQSFRSETDSNKQYCNGCHHCSKSHTADTLSQAKVIIVGCVQKSADEADVLFGERVIPKNRPLRKLNSILDGSGLLIIGGRLQHASLEIHPLQPYCYSIHKPLP